MRSFNGKNLCLRNVLETSLSNNVITSQPVNHNLKKNPIPYKSKDLKCSDKMLISKRILFKKTAIIQGKGNFQKLNELYVMQSFLARPTDSTALIAIRLKRNLRYRG